MKIAMVSGHGNTVRLGELSAALTRRGDTVTVYARRDDPDLPDRFEAPAGYTVVRVPAGPPEPLPLEELLRCMGPFAEFLDTQWAADRPDVSHAHCWMSGVAAQLAAKRRDLPAVQTFHTSWRQRMPLEEILARTASWVAATCTEGVFELMRMGRSRSRISVVPCGVDIDHFTPVGPNAVRGELHRVVISGRLLPHNGFDTVIRALPFMPNTECHIVGGPHECELDSDVEAHRLRELADGLGVSDRIRLYGSVPHEDMPAILRSADVVVCTPRYPMFGNIALEAMACGIPVVASAIGGLLDTVVPDVTGRLVSPKSPADIAEAVNRLLRDEFLRRSLGAAGRDRARARYSWDRIAADFQSIYDRLVVAGRTESTPA